MNKDDVAGLVELKKLQKDAGIPHLPTQLTYQLRRAVAGYGTLAYQWADKPHRLVYDACREIEAQADTIEAQTTRIEALEAALRFYARENSWKSCGVYMSGQSQPSAAEIDRGKRAKQALESKP